MDADLHVACEADAKKLCADVNPGEGRVQDCLRDKAVRVSGECQEELFRQEVENADDLRLSHRLFRKCNGDKNRFCPDVKYGAAAAPGAPRPPPPACRAALLRPQPAWPGRAGRCGAAPPGATFNACNACGAQPRWRAACHRPGWTRSITSLAHLATTVCNPAIGLMLSWAAQAGRANQRARRGRGGGRRCAGGARVKDCLEEHREDSGFSAECRAEFEKMMEARAADFRLDPTLREARRPPAGLRVGYEGGCECFGCGSQAAAAHATGTSDGCGRRPAAACPSGARRRRPEAPPSPKHASGHACPGSLWGRQLGGRAEQAHALGPCIPSCCWACHQLGRGGRGARGPARRCARTTSRRCACTSATAWTTLRALTRA